MFLGCDLKIDYWMLQMQKLPFILILDNKCQSTTGAGTVPESHANIGLMARAVKHMAAIMPLRQALNPTLL